MMRLCGKGCIFRSADQNFLEWENRDFVQRFADFHRACDDCEVDQTVFERLDGLRCRVVGDAQADVRIAGVEVLQAGEQHQTKCRLARTDCDKAALKRPLKSQLLLNRAELFVGNGHTLIHLFALRCQCDTLVGTDKKFAAKLTFQIVHAPCDVGLVVFQNFRGFCKAVILCYEVKNAIIIICNHKNLRRMKKKKSSMIASI